MKERGEGMNGIKCIDLIDEEKTIENGLMVCRQYAPALQQRLQDKLSTPMHTSSMINASSDVVYGKRDTMLLHRCIWEDDQIGKFEKRISDIEARDVVAGGYLRYKYMYDLPDTDIAKQLNISRSTLIRHKPKAYYLMAAWAHMIVFKSWKVKLNFVFTDKILFNQLD